MDQKPRCQEPRGIPPATAEPAPSQPVSAQAASACNAGVVAQVQMAASTASETSMAVESAEVKAAAPTAAQAGAPVTEANQSMVQTETFSVGKRKASGDAADDAADDAATALPKRKLTANVSGPSCAANTTAMASLSAGGSGRLGSADGAVCPLRHQRKIFATKHLRRDHQPHQRFQWICRRMWR